mmetsp:Transcript_8744/g.10000  ORF Transcript_8744/g.10000 Transcript_8744/m.10000 type:complete len:352 (+) Transcript_8744:432-1487(+)|eukprot:CAMPEP_0184015768 /NCGR_PEP_ID=MMETSP0954-20121128/6533_1 /TAXON_ID=627963 /ORGANISM="Aplanochytrium sp, Strain PBS07" /LENGTH=351 /DNA_ID=CAMNT_0026296667 /DNA_START=353 /DNA_END=1408 /DNA_ORIENTATION=+
MADEFSLHAIDIQSEDRDAIRNEIFEQMTTVGFLLLENIPNYDEEKYLKACKAFHALPKDIKEQLYTRANKKENSNQYRGYFPFKSNDASHKEFYDMSFDITKFPEDEQKYPLYEQTPFPDGEEYEWIQQEFSKMQDTLFEAALTTMRYIAEGLGKPKNFFDAWFDKGTLTALRSIHYEPRGAVSGLDFSKLESDSLKLTTPEHADSGVLTMLVTFGYPGLQVEIDGEYRSIKPVSNAVVVNLGGLLSRLSNYKLKATMHRVLDIGRERYSSPLFMEPRYSAVISPCMLSSSYDYKSAGDVPKREGNVLYGDWLIKRVMKFVEFHDFEIPKERKSIIEKLPATEEESKVAC